MAYFQKRTVSFREGKKETLLFKPIFSNGICLLVGQLMLYDWPAWTVHTEALEKGVSVITSDFFE